MIDSICGLHCTGCSFIESHGCKGCIETGGVPFHGECPVAKCCLSKGLHHCGECAEIPCELLVDYSCGPAGASASEVAEHSDHPRGQRINQCIRWARGEE